MKRPIVKNGTTVNSCSQPPEAAAEWFTEIKCHVFGEGTSPVLCVHACLDQAAEKLDSFGHADAEIKK